MNFCSNCGKELAGDSSFCPNCGFALQENKKQKKYSGTGKHQILQNCIKSKKTMVALVCAVVVILGAIIGVMASSNTKKAKMVDALVSTHWKSVGSDVDTEWHFVDSKKVFISHWGTSVRWRAVEVLDGPDTLVIAIGKEKSIRYVIYANTSSGDLVPFEIQNEKGETIFEMASTY